MSLVERLFFSFAVLEILLCVTALSFRVRGKSDSIKGIKRILLFVTIVFFILAFAYYYEMAFGVTIWE